jgi:hypothetical protein
MLADLSFLIQPACGTAFRDNFRVAGHPDGAGNVPERGIWATALGEAAPGVINARLQGRNNIPARPVGKPLEEGFARRKPTHNHKSATNLSAATLVPSRRTVPATAQARAATSGLRLCARALAIESLVGAPAACAVPMPNVWTRCAQ